MHSSCSLEILSVVSGDKEPVSNYLLLITMRIWAGELAVGQHSSNLWAWSKRREGDLWFDSLIQLRKRVMTLDFSSWAVLVCWIASMHFKHFPHTYLTDCTKWMFVWWCKWPPPLLFLREHLLKLKAVNKQGSLFARKLTHFSAWNALVWNHSRLPEVGRLD